MTTVEKEPVYDGFFKRLVIHIRWCLENNANASDIYESFADQLEDDPDEMSALEVIGESGVLSLMQMIRSQKQQVIVNNTSMLTSF